MLVGVHVFVIEDTEDAWEMLKGALHYCSALVTTASSADEARRRLREVRPHVIVTDLNMPDNGLVLIKAVQQFARELGADIPTVVVTAYPERLDAAREAGFVAFLTKPLDPFTLAVVVRRVAKRPGDG